jgi:hypothetical protein
MQIFSIFDRKFGLLEEGEMNGKNQTNIEPCTHRNSDITQFAPLMEVTPDDRSALASIAVIESGRVIVFRRSQRSKISLGILVRSNGVSNTTEDKLKQREKTEL